MSLPGFVILGLLASMLGLVVYAHFVQIGCDPMEAHLISNPNQVHSHTISGFSSFSFFFSFTAGAFVCKKCFRISSWFSRTFHRFIILCITEVRLEALRGISENACQNLPCSTVSSSINSLAAMAWEDFLKQYHFLEKKAHIVLKILGED